MVEPPSQLLNDFRKIKKLGEGSFGEAYLVEDMKTNERYAMKIVSKADIVDQFRMTELEFLKTADHPFIIKYISDFPFPNESIDKHCIVLEYADGCDLRQKMAAVNYIITEKVALNWQTHVCLALAQIHARGLVHRDIKPDNILIVGKEAGGVAKLGDFGTIKHILSTSKHTYRVGTCQYFAPEKRGLNYQGEADKWSLGVVLYEMVSGGQFPFDYDFENGSLDDYMSQLPHLELKQIPGNISKRCKVLIEKMLQKDPNNRPNIFDVLNSKIIKERIRLITEEQVLGTEKAERIKQQLVQLGLQKAENAEAEEQKQMSDMHDASMC
ncbi:hypothetical protein FGO68_gene16955 [Halteria grandinella]|uniref:non-specific serine/threonine protein kinase n=1 Tax=Halteria grandinella TaxID=5974 RepID=A0A8J8SW83_HALGN|nr:hypothetical protein FGO68_gene16955 [Halteria grandinella]